MISDGASALKNESRRKNAKAIIFAIILVVAIAFMFIYGVSIHQYPISFSDAFKIVMDRIFGISLDDTYESWIKDHIVVDMNIPRAIAGITIGAILAVSGAVMQSTIKNPLADPYTTGISSGALLGVTIFLALGICIIPGLNETYSLITNAFVFALIPTGMICIFTIFKKNISPSMMILIGIGVMYLFSAVSSMVRYSADPTDAHAIFHWTLGMLGRATWDNVWVLIIASIIACIFGIAITKILNAMTGGDNLAKTLGVNVRAFRIFALITIAFVTAIAVSFSGTIGFIGLVCPHIARMIVGSNNRVVVPLSALVGAAVLIFADIVARIITTTGLPVGAVTSLIGAPIFLYLLIKQKNNSW